MARSEEPLKGWIRNFQDFFLLVVLLPDSLLVHDTWL